MSNSNNGHVNVVCMKWGTLYSHDYVNKLFCMVRRNLTKNFTFYCLTDDASGIRSEIEVRPLPELYIPKKNQVSPWHKLAMFSKELYDIKGKTLFLDLDNIIINNIDAIIDYSDKFSIAENWTQIGQSIGNTTAYCFNIGEYSDILDKYLRDPERIVLEYRNEQIFVSKQLASQISFFPRNWIQSFKRHCLSGKFLRFFIEPKLPSDVKIIAFHGNPRPHNAINGEWPGKFIPYMKPALWMKDYWYED